MEGMASSRLKIKIPTRTKIPIATKDSPNFWAKVKSGVSK